MDAIPAIKSCPRTWTETYQPGRAGDTRMTHVCLRPVGHLGRCRCACDAVPEFSAREDDR